MMDKCAKCGGAANDWKCSECGDEAKAHDPNHACGGAKCEPKCKGCSEASSNCVCAPSGGKKA